MGKCLGFAVVTIVVVASGGLAACLVLSTGCAGDSSGGGSTSSVSMKCRMPARAGGFYPGDAAELKVAVDRYVSGAPTPLAGAVIALIAPHAGYEYSGETAGKSYAYLKGRKAQRVVVIGISHEDGPEPVWADDFGSYRTPLGDVPVDRAAVDRLKAAGVPLVGNAALREHSIEVQLPFLQQVFGGEWKLVPILVAHARYSDIRRAAAAIRTILDDSTVVCVSTDFTHYGASYGYTPFQGSDDEIRRKLADLDGEAVKLIIARDGAGFSDYLERTGATICNQNGVLLLLSLLPEWANGAEVAYTTSAAKTGSFAASVSYVSVVFSAGDREDNYWGAKTQGVKDMVAQKMLTDGEKETLLKLARASLEAAVRGSRRPDVGSYAVTDTLKEKRGAFVTLTIGGQLRGCIGYVEPIKPLYESVMDNALNAALHDPRFDHVKPEELKSIRVEISAMSRLEKITDISRIEVGKHGIVIARGYQSGLLLPQVATEYNWTREEFLKQTCRKAMLPADAWKDPGTTIEIFSAEVFHEKE